MHPRIQKIAATVLFVLLALTALAPLPAAAGDGGDFISSAVSNNIWILKKSTRTLIFMQFSEPAKLWKSNPVIVPPDFNLEACTLTAVGTRGTSVFLQDRASGLVTFYEAKKDHTVVPYLVVDVNESI